MLGEDPEIMLSKQNFIEEVTFKASLIGDYSDKTIQVSSL